MRRSDGTLVVSLWDALIVLLLALALWGSIVAGLVAA